MTNPEFRSMGPDDVDSDLATLRDDCALMAPRWSAPEHAESRPVPLSLIHGVTVPPRYARLLEAMSDYGD
ncbi:hypothetical protein [Streptomyces sp. NPDC048191]|uniref:hypothetical protein n=1 Tax=Streptomyces sp. NPDC048191 TaxID=3155484 RepID=UPI0033F83121